MSRTVIKRVLIMLLLSYGSFPFLFGCGTAPEGGSGIDHGSAGNSITLTWQAPQRNIDGSLLNDLAGYKVYYGFQSGSYTGMRFVKDQTICVIDDLPGDTTLHLAVTTFDKSGHESDFSEELQTYLPPL